MSQKNIVKIFLVMSIVITGMVFANKSYSLPVINEVVAKATDEKGAALPDWIELYNPGDTAADLGDWTLKDNNDTHAYLFPAGTLIGSKEYLAVKRDDPGFDFGLGKEDAVRLFNSTSDLVDETSWSDGDAPENKSWGRIPDGSGNFKTLDTPTQGRKNADNILTLADAIIVLRIVAGMPVSFSGTDINNDGKAGLEEAVYIIREISGIFPMRKPQTRTFECCGGYEDTLWDRDHVCHFQYGAVDADIYVQATPVSCNSCFEKWGLPVYDTEAWIRMNGNVSRLDAAYDFGGNHGNDFITFELEGKQFKLYHSSFGWGWRSCTPPDCIQTDQEDGCKRETCSDRPALPITCVIVEADGSVPELSDPWQKHEGKDYYPLLPCGGDYLCKNNSEDISVNISGIDGKPPSAFQVIFDIDKKSVISAYCDNGTSSEQDVACTENGVKLSNVSGAAGLVVKARGYNTAWSDLSRDITKRARQGGNINIVLRPLSSFQANEDYHTGFDKISGYSNFRSLAVEYPTEIGTSLVMKFYIDRLDKEPRVFFQNTRKHPLHYYFARNVLGLPLSLREFENQTYHGENRTAMAGSVIIYPELNIKKNDMQGEFRTPVTISFFPSDDLSPELALKAYHLIEERMLFLPLKGSEYRLFYLPAGATQDSDLTESRKSYLSAGALWMHREELYGNIRIQYLNEGLAYGILRLVTPEDLKTTPVSYKDILVLTRLANDLPIVGGTVTEELQTPLAHVNVAARTRGTPNMAMIGASSDERIKPFLNKLVRLEVRKGAFTLQETTLEEARNFWKNLIPDEQFVPLSDDNRDGLLLFSSLNFNDSVAVGAKAANLAELSRLLKDQAPEGFAVPFRYYNDFMSGAKVTADLCDAAQADCVEEGRDSAVCKKAADFCNSSVTAGDTLNDYLNNRLSDNEEFITNSGIREACLDGLRYLIHHIPAESGFCESLDSKVYELFGNQKVRLRSSTNVEDLSNFSGAGLYRSVSASVGSKDLPCMRIRKVWASVWNFQAFEERSFRNIEHKSVRMGVAVHQAFPDEEANGVLITQNIADPGVSGFYANVQLGEASVTNPEDGNLPEVFSMIQGLSGTEIIRQRYSSLSPAKPILSQDESGVLYKAAWKVQNHFSLLYGKNPWEMALELEFKIYGPDRQLFVKQVRPYFER